MEIKLISWEIENFKGIKSHKFDTKGSDTELNGDNGVGKTSIRDAFGWTMFDKDGTGSTKFQSRPNDLKGNPIQDLVVSSTFILSIDGVLKTFKRQNKPKIARNVVTKHENLYWINDVPKKLKEYKEVVAEIIQEDTFKILTNSSYFAENFHWTKKRELLLSISDETETPSGFDSLMDKLEGRTVEELKKTIKDKIKSLDKQLEEIKPRIDEQQRNIDGYAERVGDKEAEQIEIRKQLEIDLEAHKEQYSKIEEKKEVYSLKLGEVGKAKRDLIDLGVQKLVFKPDEEKVKLIEAKAIEITSVKLENEEIKKEKNKHNDELESLSRKLKSMIDEKLELRKTWEKIQENKKKIEKSCFHCLQLIPKEIIQELEAKEDKKAQEIGDRGKKLTSEIEMLEDRRDKKEKFVKSLQDPDLKKEDVLSQEMQDLNDSIAIDKKLFEDDLQDPKKSEAYLLKIEEIEKLEKLAEEFSPKSLEDEYQIKKDAILEELRICSHMLQECDKAKKSAERIEELKDDEVLINKTILTQEKELEEIDKYNRAESELIEKNVNQHFKYANFKMFTELKKGSIEQCCEITMNGVQYHELSTGQKTLVGLDIINTLSKHYNYKVMIFIDNAEGFHLKSEQDCQTIRLNAIKGLKTLTANIV